MSTLASDFDHATLDYLPFTSLGDTIKSDQFGSDASIPMQPSNSVLIGYLCCAASGSSGHRPPVSEPTHVSDGDTMMIAYLATFVLTTLMFVRRRKF